jgi:hypothetical protein
MSTSTVEVKLLHCTLLWAPVLMIGPILELKKLRKERMLKQGIINVLKRCWVESVLLFVILLACCLWQRISLVGAILISSALSISIPAAGYLSGQAFRQMK